LELFDIEADKSASDISRVTYESYDPGILIREFDDVSIFNEITVQDYKRPPQSNGKKSGLKSQLIFDGIINNLAISGSYFVEKNRNTFIYQLACECNKFGFDKQVTIDLIKSRFFTNPLNIDEVQSTVTSSYNKKLEHGTTEIEPLEDDEVTIADFPLHCIPDKLQLFLKELNSAYNYPVEYSAAGLLSMVGSAMGNNYKVRVKHDWITPAIMWHAVVGTPGNKKSHPVKTMLSPSKAINRKYKAEYKEKLKEYLDNKALDKKEQDTSIFEPKMKLFMINDATVESLALQHLISPNGLLVYRDELIGWFNAIGQYKNGKGSDMEFWMESFNNSDANVSRVSRDTILVEDVNINIIGTIQPEKLLSIPSDNGLLHRFLFTNVVDHIPYMSIADVSRQMFRDYNDMILHIFKKSRESKDIFSYKMDMPGFIIIDKYLTDYQRRDDIAPGMVQYIEKMKSYTPRFYLLLTVLWEQYISKPDNIIAMVSDLIKYYISTAESVFSESEKIKDAIRIESGYKGKTKSELITIALMKGIKVKQICMKFKVSRQYVSKIKKLKKIA